MMFHGVFRAERGFFELFGAFRRGVLELESRSGSKRWTGECRSSVGRLKTAQSISNSQAFPWVYDVF